VTPHLDGMAEAAELVCPTCATGARPTQRFSSGVFHHEPEQVFCAADLIHQRIKVYREALDPEE
jgi:hypothetical protein